MPTPYDSLAADYAVHRSTHPVLLRKLVELCRSHSALRVLEVGCGTGNYVAALAKTPSIQCAGMDPSSKMLDAAREKGAPVSWHHGSAESLPFPDASFDFIYSVDVIHHIQDRVSYFAEAFRVLTPGGCVVTATDSAETIRGRVHSHYFPEVVEPEIRRYPRGDEIPRLLRLSGFQEISEEMVESPYVLADASPFERKVFSSLLLISEEEFQKGLAHLKRDLKVGPISCVSRYLVFEGRKL